MKILLISLVIPCFVFPFSEAGGGIVDPSTSRQPTGGIGQHCGTFGNPLPGTICSDWCVMKSPIGSCNPGGECCLVFQNSEGTGSGGMVDLTTSRQPTGGIDQNCGTFGVPIPGTICSDWCVDRSIGSCNPGGKCCRVIMKYE